MPLTIPLTPAQLRVQQDINQIHAFLTDLKHRVDNGLPAIPARPAQGNIPAFAGVAAITPEDYKAALGDDLAILETIFAAAL